MGEKIQLISKKLFIHIPKNGGSAIKKSQTIQNKVVVLEENDSHMISEQYAKDLCEFLRKYNEYHNFDQCRWRDIKPEIREKYQAFAIVRNPWSKVVSRYTFLKLLFANEENRVVNNPFFSECSFEEFLEERHTYGKKKYFWNKAIRGWHQQLDHVTDENENLKCEILRFEHYEEDMMKYLNLSEPIQVNNVSNGEVIDNKVFPKKDYREFYSPETKKIVADWYAKDIEFFGFTFDGAATKNIWNI